MFINGNSPHQNLFMDIVALISDNNFNSNIRLKKGRSTKELHKFKLAFRAYRIFHEKEYSNYSKNEMRVLKSIFGSSILSSERNYSKKTFIESRMVHYLMNAAKEQELLNYNDYPEYLLWGKWYEL